MYQPANALPTSARCLEVVSKGTRGGIDGGIACCWRWIGTNRDDVPEASLGATVGRALLPHDRGSRAPRPRSALAGSARRWVPVGEAVRGILRCGRLAGRGVLARGCRRVSE